MFPDRVDTGSVNVFVGDVIEHILVALDAHFLLQQRGSFLSNTRYEFYVQSCQFQNTSFRWFISRTKVKKIDDFS